jgi:hypothetical protein
MFEQSQESLRPYGMVRNLITEAFELAPTTLHLSEADLESLTATLSGLPFPEVDEVSRIVARSLAAAGESTEDANEHASSVAGKLVDGLNTLDLSL